MQLGVADLQGVERPMFEQDTELFCKRMGLKITKADQSITLTAKDKDVQRKKVKDYGPDGGSSCWSRFHPFRQSAKKVKEKRLPPGPPQLEDLYCPFSLAEIRVATNNLDENLVLGAYSSYRHV